LVLGDQRQLNLPGGYDELKTSLPQSRLVLREQSTTYLRSPVFDENSMPTMRSWIDPSHRRPLQVGRESRNLDL
jgi:hypothetical protein